MPTHRIVLALAGDEVVELRAASTAGTFAAYRRLPDAVHGMIAWPNTVLLTGPEPVVVDPGYQTQGDMLAGALRRRGLEPGDVGTVLMTHLHSDHASALPQLGDVDLYVHEAELGTEHARTGRGWRDGARVHELRGSGGELWPGVRWIHTPGHSPGHVVYVVDDREGPTLLAGDTLGPDPAWFDRMELPEGFPEREAHLTAFRAIRAQAPRRVVPGHNPPFALRE